LGSPIYNEEKQINAQTYTAQDRNVRESEYMGTVGAQTLSQDYRPPKPYKPVEHDRADIAGGTAHWQSEYGAGAQKGPTPFAHSPRVRPPDASMNGKGFSNHLSSYTHEFGRYGSNPRDRIKLGASALPILKTDLLIGTTTGTDFMPGYQGFIPTHPSTEASRRVATGPGDRPDTKNDYSDTYHANKIGYTGHRPKSFRNDHGGRQPTTLTISGRDYVTPRSFKDASPA
jgi:hypothetical protein